MTKQTRPEKTDETYITYGYLYPKPERAAELKQHLHDLIAPTRTEEGSIYYDVYEEGG